MPGFVQAMNDVRRDRPRRIDLDMAELTFIDSEALGVLAEQHKSCAAAGIELRVLNVSPPMMKILRLMRLDQLFALSPAPEEEADDESPIVLVIDDDEMVLTFCTSQLNHLGYRSIGAADPTVGLEIFRARHTQIDVVILDALLPGMECEQALAALKQIDPAVRVIVSSGMASEDLAPFLEDPCVCGILEKPYRPRQLTRLVDQAVSGRQRT
jgi:anti-anti-sigma factor